MKHGENKSHKCKWSRAIYIFSSTELMTIKEELIETFVVNITPEVFIDSPTCSALILPPSIHVIRFIIQIISDQCVVVYCLSTCDKSLAKLYLKGCQPVLMETVMFWIRNLTFSCFRYKLGLWLSHTKETIHILFLSSQSERG